MTRNTCHVTCDTWHMPCDTWQVGGKCNLSKKFPSLPLRVGEWRCTKDISTNHHLRGLASIRTDLSLTNLCSMVWKLFRINFGTQLKLRHHNMIKWALAGRLLHPVLKSEKIPSQAGTLLAARLLQPNLCPPGAGTVQKQTTSSLKMMPVWKLHPTKHWPSQPVFIYLN